MDKSIRDRLEEKFDPRFISSRTGTGGKKMSYLAGAQYIQRLNDVAEGEWSYVVVEHFATEKIGQKTSKGEQVYNLVVLVEVRAFGQVRQAFGGSVTPAGECQGDDWKSALTDALKKAIASFGVALDLYTKGELAREAEEEPEREPQPKPAPRREETRTESRPTSKPSNSPPANGSSATEPQRRALFAITKGLGWDETTFKAWLKKQHGVESTKDLTPKAASAAIDALKKLEGAREPGAEG
jgi:hypothetical protein